MGQVISSIFGGTETVTESERPIPGEDYSPPVLPCYYTGFTEERDRKTAAAAARAFHPHYHGVPVSPQPQRRPAVSDQSAEDNLRQPLTACDHPLVATAARSRFEETKELINKAAKDEAASMERKKTEYKSPEIEEAIAFHRLYRGVTTCPKQQQQQTVSDQLAKDLCLYLIATDPAVATRTAALNVEETKELDTKAAKEEGTSSERRRRRRRRRNIVPENKEPIRKIGPYASTHKILLVGEGDFSFSASLAAAFGYASNIVATSLNNKRYLRKNYTKAMANIEELESKGALVFHGVNATKMANHGELLAGMKFDRIIFNFPHTGLFDESATHLSRNQMLVAGFLKNAKKMIEKDGEIHVTHKTSRAFIKWKIAELASMEGLRLIEEVPFHPSVYRGYHTKHGFGGNKDFHCYPSSSYRFGLSCGGLSDRMSKTKKIS